MIDLFKWVMGQDGQDEVRNNPAAVRGRLFSPPDSRWIAWRRSSEPPGVLQRALTGPYQEEAASPLKAILAFKGATAQRYSFPMCMHEFTVLNL